MTPLETKRLKVELMRIQAAAAEMELKIEERLEDIARIKAHIEIQRAREEELKQQLAAAAAAE